MIKSNIIKTFGILLFFFSRPDYNFYYHKGNDQRMVPYFRGLEGCGYFYCIDLYKILNIKAKIYGIFIF